MFNIGDLIIYSSHGICKIDDICEKTVAGITRQYYVLHPVDNHHELTISTPVDNDKVLELVTKDEATKILESFQYPGIQWEEKPNVRLNLFNGIINTGNRKEIAKVINTIIRKKIESEHHDKKFSERDLKLLNTTKNILFQELALSLNTSFEEIEKIVAKTITESYH